jgi:cytoskeletal protein RodZ
VVHLDEDSPCDPATFGEALRRAREDAGLRIDDIAAETKVSRGILNALENGDFRLLPERVFSRSFVAQYALTVGADDRPLLRAFDEAWEGYCASSGTHPNLEVIAEDLGTSIRWRFWLPIATGILILLIAAAVILRGSTSMDDVLAPDPRRSGVRLAAKSLERQLTAIPTPRMQPAEPAIEPGAERMVDLTVIVDPGKESWIHYRDRDGKTGQSLLTDGERLELVLAGPIKLTVGNAGAVRITVGDRSFSDLGLPGQVIHTEVTGDGFTRFGRGEVAGP